MVVIITEVLDARNLACVLPRKLRWVRLHQRSKKNVVEPRSGRGIELLEGPNELRVEQSNFFLAENKHQNQQQENEKDANSQSYRFGYLMPFITDEIHQSHCTQTLKSIELISIAI